jgi:acyl carrier protein
MTSIADDIRQFILARYPTAALDDGDDIFSLGYVNSLFAMELVVFVESHFEISIPNDELNLDNFRTVKVMTDLVGRLTLDNAAR